MRRLIQISLLVCSLALAQDAPEVTSQQTPATFTSRVDLVSVPVVVRDSKGRAVGSLQKDDFRLFDNGKQQVIARFSMSRFGSAGTSRPGGNSATVPGERSSAAPSELLPDRYIAYVFDDIHMNFADLSRMRIAMERHLAESLGPNGRAAIATTSGRVFLDFTNDRDKLHDALLRLKPGPQASQPDDADLGGKEPCPPAISCYQADQAVNYQNPDAIRAAEAAAVACYGSDPAPPSLGMLASHAVLDAGNADTKNTFHSLADLIRRLSVMPGARSIVLVTSGFFVTRDFYQAESALVDSAIRDKVTLNGIDARGVYTANSDEANAAVDAARRLTQGTGGSFFEHDNGLKEGLDQLANPPEYTYLLAFSPQNLKLDGSYHRLKVALVNAKGLSIEARLGYYAPNQAVSPAEQAKEEIQDAMFSLDEIGDIPFDVTTEFFKSSDTGAELTVSSHLDLKGLKFRGAGDRNEDTLTVVTGLFDQDGRYVKGIQKVIDLRLRVQTLEKLRGSGIVEKETFDVPLGRYVVRVVVRDSEGKAMAARNGTVDIQ